MRVFLNAVITRSGISGNTMNRMRRILINVRLSMIIALCVISITSITICDTMINLNTCITIITRGNTLVRNG